MKLREWLREWYFQLTHRPHSPEGLRHRADRLVKSGVSEDNPYVRSLRKQAEQKEQQT